jgi:hypothetical protein
MVKFVKKKIIDVKQICQKLRQFIDNIEDKKAAAIYTLFKTGCRFIQKEIGTAGKAGISCRRGRIVLFG